MIYPQILQRAIARDFANRKFDVRETRKNTFMVTSDLVCVYYVLNADQSDIIDLQVD